jgi:hypothetical protein
MFKMIVLLKKKSGMSDADFKDYYERHHAALSWRIDAGLFRGFADLDREALGIPDESVYLASYCARRGISLPTNWAFYLAFSFFRLASILQGVQQRARRGNASSADAPEVDTKAAAIGAVSGAVLTLPHDRQTRAQSPTM